MYCLILHAFVCLESYCSVFSESTLCSSILANTGQHLTGFTWIDRVFTLIDQCLCLPFKYMNIVLGNLFMNQFHCHIQWYGYIALPISFDG